VPDTALLYAPAGGIMQVVVSRQNAGSGEGAILHFAGTAAGPGIAAEVRVTDISDATPVHMALACVLLSLFLVQV